MLFSTCSQLDTQDYLVDTANTRTFDPSTVKREMMSWERTCSYVKPELLLLRTLRHVPSDPIHDRKTLKQNHNSATQEFTTNSYHTLEQINSPSPRLLFP